MFEVIIDPIQETPDIHSSSDEYAERFSGKVGAWMLEVQSEIILN
jgi:hypothetical protein